MPNGKAALSLGVAIMAHPKRAANVTDLQAKLAPVAPTIVWDEKHSVWDTGRRALLSYNTRYTHWLVLQDDAVLPRHLIAGCLRMLRHVPRHAPVSLYTGRVRTSNDTKTFRMSPILTVARRRRASFAVFEGPWWGVGIILPTTTIRSVVRFGDRRTDIPQYDHKIAHYFADRGVPCWYTLPSLVDHIHDGTNMSLLGHGDGGGRRALWFAGEQRSATSITWTPRHIGVKDLPRSVRRSFPPTPEYPRQA